MREIRVRFQRNKDLDHIDVLISAPERDAAVTKLLEQLSGENRPEALSLQSIDGKILRVFPDDIISVSVRDKLSLLQTEEGMFTVRQSLQSLESMLEGAQFLRISRHELINVDKIQRCDLKVNRELKIELTGGVETWASHRCIPAVLQRLQLRQEG